MSIDPNSNVLLKLRRDWNCYSFTIDGGVSSESESWQLIIITNLVPWPCILFKDFYCSNTDIVYNWR